MNVISEQLINSIQGRQSRNMEVGHVRYGQCTAEGDLEIEIRYRARNKRTNKVINMVEKHTAIFDPFTGQRLFDPMTGERLELEVKPVDRNQADMFPL